MKAIGMKLRKKGYVGYTGNLPVLNGRKANIDTLMLACWHEGMLGLRNWITIFRLLHNHSRQNRAYKPDFIFMG